MKLQWIKQGIAGSGDKGAHVMEDKEEGNGEIEWSWHPHLETSKRKFFL